MHSVFASVVQENVRAFPEIPWGALALALVTHISRKKQEINIKKLRKPWKYIMQIYRSC